MQKSTNNIVLFLTACVNPSGMSNTALQDVDIRKQQYLEAINFYLKTTPYKILVVENSMYDLSPYFYNNIEKDRLEFLTFDGNQFDKKLGKGYGEALIMNHAFMNSTFIQSSQSVIKISGRHIITNVNNIVKVSGYFIGKASKFVVCVARPSIKLCVSDFIYASTTFYLDYLNKKSLECDESQRIWFEHKLYDSLVAARKENYKYIYPPFKFDQIGTLGSTGQNLVRAKWYNHVIYLIRSIKSFILCSEF